MTGKEQDTAVMEFVTKFAADFGLEWETTFWAIEDTLRRWDTNGVDWTPGGGA